MGRNTFLQLLRDDALLVLPGVHDAASAKLAELAGFQATAVGGAAISALHYGLPDLGLMSFGDYEAVLKNIIAASPLPSMIDAEHGFGDLKVTARSVQRLAAIGAGALAIEDMRFPPRVGRPPQVVGLDEISRKLEVALSHRPSADLGIVGRTDSMVQGGIDEVLRRARRYQEIGVDAVLATGLQSREQYQALRDAVHVPIVAIILESGPWHAPSHDELSEIGINAALYPAALMLRAMGAVRAGLAELQTGSTQLAAGSFSYPDMAAVVDIGKWAALDQKEPDNG